ncbi:hypothetical protein L2089_15385 [Paenibacillus hunanensis]|uniref:hypothetical protein n=1 Tax=Paenibacillus hunanensis TaxID=539262 RepID=UPI002027404B|nr:hypothetical protein [Paenibacillus hunanensis]MCL9662076.1 hypothetical protein [Paenibacillus hunanensis]
MLYRDKNLKGKITAAFILHDSVYEEEQLYLACSSITSDQTGHYIVAAYRRREQLIIAHTCPASKTNQTCWHVAAAVEAYQNYYWWKPDIQHLKVTLIHYAHTLRPEYIQIPIPGEELNLYTGGN